MDRNLSPSFKSLSLTLNANGAYLSSGTGFVVTKNNENFLITNRHIVTGRDNNTGDILSETTGAVPDEIVVIQNEKDRFGSWLGISEPLYLEEDRPRWIEHPIMEAGADFVALPLTEDPRVDYFPYSLDKPENGLLLGPSERVNVVGFPYGKTANGASATWITGFIATEPTPPYDGKPTFLINSGTRRGQSGSPVIAFRSSEMVTFQNGNSYFINEPITELLGVYSGRIDKESDLGIVWKTAAIRELIDFID